MLRLEIGDASPIDPAVGILNADPDITDSSFSDPLRTGLLPVAACAGAAWLERHEQVGPCQILADENPIEQRVLRMLAVT